MTTKQVKALALAHARARLSDSKDNRLAMLDKMARLQAMQTKTVKERT
jgi:hypothetical protein